MTNDIGSGSGVKNNPFKNRFQNRRYLMSDASFISNFKATQEVAIQEVLKPHDVSQEVLKARTPTLNPTTW